MCISINCLQFVLILTFFSQIYIICISFLYVGIRTMSMVCLGSCFFSMTGQLAFKSSTMGWDAARVAAAIPSGKFYLMYIYCVWLALEPTTLTIITSHSLKRATIRGWILGRWFDMEGYNDNFAYNYKWGTIDIYLPKHTRIDNSGKRLAGSCCRRSCWGRFTSVYCQVRKTFYAQLSTHMCVCYIYWHSHDIIYTKLLWSSACYLSSSFRTEHILYRWRRVAKGFWWRTW